jgi:plasmid maintenance system antidote protein VapI
MSKQFLDWLIESQHLKNDAALARQLEITPPVISKLRHGKLGVGSALVLKAHEVFGLPIRELKAKAGLPCLPIGGRVRDGQ